MAIVSSPNKPYYKALFCRSFFLYLLVPNHMLYVIDLLLSWGTLQTLLWSHLTCFLVSEICEALTCRKILFLIYFGSLHVVTNLNYSSHMELENSQVVQLWFFGVSWVFFLY